jgi:hypothetical protein
MKIKVHAQSSQTLEGEQDPPSNVFNHDNATGSPVMERNEHWNAITALYKEGIYPRAIVTFKNIDNVAKIDPRNWGIVVAIKEGLSKPVEANFNGRTIMSTGEDLHVIYRGCVGRELETLMERHNHASH